MSHPYRYSFLAIVLLSLLTPPAKGQEPSPRPFIAVTGGLGNVLGGLGAGVEYYLAQSRVSGAVGLGYWPGGSSCSGGTFAGAPAMRAFTGGRRHRVFLELSYSLLAVSCPLDSDDIERHYGPGISLGYRYTGSDGFTFTAGGGLGEVSGDFGTEGIVLLGLGYTWRR
jgi:hypothetical protein